MRHLYLACYDVSDAKRLRKMFKTMRRYGNHVQYSVFTCELSPSEKVLLYDDVRKVLHEDEDSFLTINLGPSNDRSLSRFEYLGRRPDQLTIDDTPRVI